MKVLVSKLYVGHEHALGMNLEHVLGLVYGTITDNRPIEVTRNIDLFRIVNGRHRYVAALIRGDKFVECEEEIMSVDQSSAGKPKV